MKKTIAYLFAALAIVTAASCTKDEQLNNEEQSGSRVIELIFDNGDATKVGVSDRTPQWEDGDQIWLSDGTNSETVTLTESDIDKTNNIAKITTTLSGTLYAVYPASAQNGVSGDGEEKQIGFKIPTSTDGSFGKAHISVAKGETSLAFKNVVSILKITTEAATKIVNISSTLKIAGEFKVTYSTLAIAAGTNQADGINVTSSAAGDKYVAVASGIAFNALDFTVVKGATVWASKKSTQSTETAIKKIYDMGSVADWSLTYSTNGSLWAKFSVSSTTKVRFSQGNLYYNGSAFQFEDNQYDYRHYNGKTNDAAVIGGTSTTTPSGTVGSFFWSKTASVAYAESYSESGTTTSDVFFTNQTTTTPKSDFTVNGATGLWRTLSGGDSGEWKYLMETRTNAASKVGYATVAGVKGIIILPDTFTDPMKNGGSGAFVPKSTTGYTANTYTAGANWDAMEAAGALFLPAAGDRYGSSVINVGYDGYFWSSTAYNSDYAYYLYFSSYYVNPANFYYRFYGYSVRLVSAAQ